MLPYIESSVSIENKKSIVDFDSIAIRLGLIGYAVNHFSLKDCKSADGKNKHVRHYARMDATYKTVNKVRDFLAKERKNCHLCCVTTTDAKIAQWSVKDNRVDILSIPEKYAREIITEQLANVAAENQTFLEIDLTAIIHSKKRKSVVLRNLTRVMNLILKQKALYVFTINAKQPLEFREMRSILALGRLIGAPELRTKECMKAFHARIVLNEKKLSEDFITTGIWKAREIKQAKDAKKKEVVDTIEIIEEELPIEFIELPEEKRRLERQRYILFEILSEKKNDFEKKDIEDALWKEIVNHYGSVGSSRMGLYFSYFNSKQQIGIIRCTNHSLEALRAVFAVISEINESKVLLHIMKVSGTIRSLVRIAKKKEESS